MRVGGARENTCRRCGAVHYWLGLLPTHGRIMGTVCHRVVVWLGIFLGHRAPAAKPKVRKHVHGATIFLKKKLCNELFVGTKQPPRKELE